MLLVRVGVVWVSLHSSNQLQYSQSQIHLDVHSHKFGLWHAQIIHLNFLYASARGGEMKGGVEFSTGIPLGGGGVEFSTGVPLGRSG